MDVFILAGGAGAGLWPYSRASHPKAVLPFVGEQSLLRATVDRCARLAGPVRVLGLDAHRFLIGEQLRETTASIVLEPEARNTAMAIAVAAYSVAESAILWISPADITIDDEAALIASLAKAEDEANRRQIVVFGVRRPPEPQFGRICTAEATGFGGFIVAEFAEKPTTPPPVGDVWVNSGMLVARADVLRAALEASLPGIAAAAAASVARSRRDLDFIRLAPEPYVGIPSVSFENDVLPNVSLVMVPLATAWADIGSWESLLAQHPADGSGNVIRGDVVTLDAQRCFIDAQHHLVTVLGLDDVVIVDTADALLVASRARVGDVTALVARLGDRPEVDHHRRVARPWGAYETLDHGDQFQVKRITVLPGASLSRQLHHRRAEHWIVVRGVASVERGDTRFELKANESTFIPLGVQHRLENAGTEPLEIIEVQSGEYFGEDDIVRFADRYGRG